MLFAGLIVDLFNWTLEYLLSLRPEWECHLPQEAFGLIGMLKGLNLFLPIDTIGTILGLCCLAVIAFLTFKFIAWIAENLPTGG